MYEVENVTNAMNDVLAYEEAFRKKKARMDVDRLRDEAIELMVKEPKPEVDEDSLRDQSRFDRNTEPQDNEPSGAVKSD